MNQHLRVVWLLPLLFFSSCSTPKMQQSAPGQHGLPSAGTKTSASAPFVLGPNDELSITVWRNDDLQRKVKVDPEGKIDLPLAGNIKAGGLTVSELREEVTSRLSKYIINPQVDINLSSFESRRVHVLGEVKSPGAVTLDRNLMLWESIAKAGGFTDRANQKSVLLVRAEGDTARASAQDLRMKNLIDTGTVAQSAYLRDGDVVFVPRSRIGDIENFLGHFNQLIDPFISLERAVIFAPTTIDALRGDDVEGGPNLTISP